MTENILEESLIRSKSLFDITNFRNNYDIGDTNVDSPVIELLNQNYEFLLNNSIKIDLPKKYYQKPQYLSKEIYNTYDWWFIILYMNHCFSMEDFILDKVIIPDKESIMTILKNK